MARCGCQGAASNTCEAIILCVAQALGPGLSYNSSTGQIQVRRSRDGGNCLRFGSDRGLYVPCNGGGDPGGGGRTVEGLPDQVIAGTFGGSALLHAYASPQAIEYAAGNQIDIIDVFSWATADQVAVWAPFGPNTTVSFYTDNPADIPGRQVTSSAWTQMSSDCGVPGGNPTGRNSGARPEDLSPDGGWYGFYQRPYGLMTTVEALRQVAARSVVILQHGHEGSYDVNANAQAILALQAQEWVIPSVGTTAQAAVSLYLDLGIPHVGINVGSNTTLTPAQAVESGATWVKIDEDQDPARVQAFIDSGLNVLTNFTARHTTGRQWLDNGARGLISGDPVYSRGVLGTGFQGYKTGNLSFQTRTTEVGMLTEPTDRTDILDGRGYSEQDEHGRFFQPEFNWSGGVSRSTHAQLLGAFCPISTPNNYTLSMDVQVDQTPGASGSMPKLGWIIADDNDLDPSSPIGDPVPTTRHGYFCFIRVGDSNPGMLNIGVFSADGIYSELGFAEAQSPIPANEWISLEVEVTPNDITLRRTDGTPYEVTVADTAWRGPYAFYAWEDKGDTGEGFAHGYRNNVFASTGGGGVVWDQLTQTYGTWDDMAQAKPTWAELAQAA